MAAEFADAAFWLPADFLDDDDIFLAEKTATAGSGASSPHEESPVEWATVSEDDEEGYVAGLTLRMAHSFLGDDDKAPSALAAENPKAMASSPQSTLLGCLSASDHESPNGPSQVSSPTSSPLEQAQGDRAWDLLSEAAGEVMRLRQGGEPSLTQQNFPGAQLLGTAKKPSPSPVVSVPSKSAAAGFYPNPVLAQRQFQASQFYHLKQQLLLKQQQQQLSAASWGRHRSRGGGGCDGDSYGDGWSGPPLGLPSTAWPPLQKQQQPLAQPVPGMHAVFLAGAKKESGGTGVFLPRSVGAPADSRKRPTCSTVLLPARVVQALKLNLDDLGRHPRYPGGFVLDHEALISRSNTMLAQQKRSGNSHRPQLHQQPSATTTHELNLPQEWTY